MIDKAIEREKARYIGVMIQLCEWHGIKLFRTGRGIESFDVEGIEVFNA